VVSCGIDIDQSAITCAVLVQSGLRSTTQRPVRRSEGLVAPGPRVTKQMPGRPVALPAAYAIIEAPPLLVVRF